MRLALGVCLLAASAVSAVGEGGRAIILTVDDSIQPASLRYLKRGIEVADSSGATVTILELNTPGGLLTSLRQMTTLITSAQRPVVVYVTPSGGQAASAGFFLLVAADVAAMSPGTNTGAAHPVAGEGQEMPETLSEKVTNDAAALIRSLAEQRGRPVEWAERAVRESLSYTEREALEKGLIDLVAGSRGELLQMLDGRTIRRFDGREETLEMGTVQVVEVLPNAVDRLLSVIAHPNIAYLLFMLGLVGIYFELSNPGAIFPGVLGGIALLLALFALSVLPINYVGALLILLGIVFFVLEVMVTSYGLLTVAGLVSFVLGSLMLVDSPVPGMRVSLAIILPTAAVVAFLVVFLITRVVAAFKVRPLTGAEGLVDKIGEALSDIHAEGRVFVHGEYWSAFSADPIPAGARVRVVKVQESRLEVAAVPDSSGSAG